MAHRNPQRSVVDVAITTLQSNIAEAKNDRVSAEKLLAKK